MGRSGVLLVGVLLAHAAVAFAYLVSIPPWEAPDEPADFLRIRNFACRLDLGLAEGWTCAGPRPVEDLGIWHLQPVDAADPPAALCRNLLLPMRLDLALR